MWDSIKQFKNLLQSLEENDIINEDDNNLIDEDDSLEEDDLTAVGSIESINFPIEQRNTGKGQPSAILHMGRPLNNRQQKLLEQLPYYRSEVIVSKNSVNMKDLSALTAYTGDEFALFTKGNERLVVRGNSFMVDIGIEQAMELNSQGYKWSGHTHPGIDENCLMASQGDKEILRCFRQDISYIYNSLGARVEFGKE